MKIIISAIFFILALVTMFGGAELSVIMVDHIRGGRNKKLIILAILTLLVAIIAVAFVIYACGILARMG